MLWQKGQVWMRWHLLVSHKCELIPRASSKDGRDGRVTRWKANKIKSKREGGGGGGRGGARGIASAS